jgi:hypothetical protein
LCLRQVPVFVSSYIRFTNIRKIGNNVQDITSAFLEALELC